MDRLFFISKTIIQIVTLIALIGILASCSFIKNTPEPTIIDHPKTLPPGSYQQYCKDCELDWPFMQCSCLDSSTDTLAFSRIDVSECTKQGLEIKSDKGQLVCESLIPE